MNKEQILTPCPAGAKHAAGAFCWAVTGTLHGCIIEADTEGKARYIFHAMYNGESIVHIIKLNVPACLF